MVKRRIRVKKKKQNFFSTVLIVMVIFMIMIVVTFKCVELEQKQKVYAKKEAKLLEEMAKEEQRALEIEEYEKYTQTKKYVEEVAKEKLGLVNENEIIFKEE